MTDLIHLMGRLVDVNGNILVPGVDEMVPPADEEEKAIYEKLDYSVQDIEDNAGGSVALSANKVGVFLFLWLGFRRIDMRSSLFEGRPAYGSYAQPLTVVAWD